jgi:hypothetical protein
MEAIPEQASHGRSRCAASGDGRADEAAAVLPARSDRTYGGRASVSFIRCTRIEDRPTTVTGSIGRRLTGYALVRFAENGEWFADCPVVFDFDGVQVELCHWKLDELSIGWNTIDTAAVITGWDWSGLTPEWSCADGRLGQLVGQELREVALLVWRPSGHDLADGTVAVEFVLAAGRFHIVNGLDENSVEVGAAQPDYVRHRLSR